jgi:membrane-associated protease RseP (regulator of RpoE activity)
VKTDDDMRPEPPAVKGDDAPRLAHDRLLQAAQAPPPDKRISLVLGASLVLLLAMSGGWSLLVVVAGLIVMIVLHELGHFLTAKASGMKVTEFFLGFGPKLWSVQRGETEYGIKAIPAGAYVRIIGMNNLEEIAPEDEPRTYRQQSYPRRLSVALAGSAMHFLQALVLIFIALTIVGTPGGHVFTDQPAQTAAIIGTITPGSAADAAHLRSGDRIVSVDAESISDFERLHDVLVAHAGQSVTIEFDRNGQRMSATTTLGPLDPTKGVLGVTRQPIATKRLDPIHAAGQTGSEVAMLTRDTVGFFGAFFSPSGISDFADTVVHGGNKATVSGDGSSSTTSNEPSPDENRPISIIGAARIGSELTRNGWLSFIMFFASINVVIGLYNLIPLLPLDGGHVAIATYERIRSRRGKRYQVDITKLMPITYMVVMLLFLVTIASLYLDIVHPLKLQ